MTEQFIPEDAPASNEPTPCDREGIFVAYPRAVAIQTADSGSVQVVISFLCRQLFHGGKQYDVNQTCFGQFNLIKKDGTPNAISVQQLVSAFGWDGNIESLENPAWLQTAVCIQTERNEYNGKVSYRANGLTAYSDSPQFGGGLRSADAATKSSLAQRHGASLRAMASQAASPATRDTAPFPPATEQVPY